jgi:hypothetical protein
MNRKNPKKGVNAHYLQFLMPVLRSQAYCPITNIPNNVHAVLFVFSLHHQKTSATLYLTLAASDAIEMKIMLWRKHSETLTLLGACKHAPAAVASPS